MTTVVVNLLIMVIGLGSGVLTARGLDPDARGVFLTVLLWSSLIAAYSLLGLDQALIYASGGDWARAMSSSRQMRRRVTVLAFVATLLAIVVNLFLLESVGGQACVTALLGASAVPLNAATQLRLSPLLAAGRLWSWNLVRVSSPLTYVAFLGGLVAMGDLTVISSLGALGLSNLLTWLIALRASARPVVEPTDDLALGELVTYGQRIILVGLPGYLSSKVDQLLMGLLLAPAVLGVYAVAVSVAAVAEVVRLTVDQLLFPRYVRLGWRRRDARLASLVAVVGTCVAGLLCLPVLGAAIRFVYGTAYVGAVDPLPWLLIAAGFRVGIAVLSAALKASGQLSEIAWGATAGLLVCAACMVALLPLLGAVGAAAAILVGQVINWWVVLLRLNSGHTPAASLTVYTHE